MIWPFKKDDDDSHDRVEVEEGWPEEKRASGPYRVQPPEAELLVLKNRVAELERELEAARAPTRKLRRKLKAAETERDEAKTENEKHKRWWLEGTSGERDRIAKIEVERDKAQKEQERLRIALFAWTGDKPSPALRAFLASPMTREQREIWDRYMSNALAGLGYEGSFNTALKRAHEAFILRPDLIEDHEEPTETYYVPYPETAAGDSLCTACWNDTLPAVVEANQGAHHTCECGQRWLWNDGDRCWERWQLD